MSEPVTPPPPSGPPAAQASGNRPVTSLVLGIIGIVCCGLAAPFAWYLGKQELDAIAAGQAPAAGQGMARAGMILGIIGSVLLVLSVFWVILGGGMAVIQSMSGM